MKKKTIVSIVLSVILLLSITTYALAAVIDFDNFTEVDPGSVITKSSQKIEWNNLLRQSDAYVYYDFGAGYFSDNFTFFGSFCTVAFETNHQVNIWAVSNYVGSWLSCETANSSTLTLTLNKTPATAGIELNEEVEATGNRNSSSEWESATLTNTEFFYKVYRNCTTDILYCYLYSDEQMNTLVQTLTLNLTEDHDYRYFYGLQSSGYTGASKSSGWVTNFSFENTDPASITNPDHFNGSEYEETTTDNSSSYPSYCDENEKYWSYISGAWDIVGTCVSEVQHTGVVIKDEIEDTINDTRELWGLDSVAGGYITGLALILIVGGIMIYYKQPKWLIIGCEAVAFGACFALGLFEIWLIVIGAILGAVFIWWKVGGKTGKP